MQFKIPCETYIRLAGAVVPHPVKPVAVPLQCIRIERQKGFVVALATNNRICVVEKIDATTEPDGAVNIRIDPVLLQQCELEKQFDSELIIDVIDLPGVQVVTCKSTFGYSHNGDIGVFPTPEEHIKYWQNWREKIIPYDQPKKSNGFLMLDTVGMEQLTRCSPSGVIVFPEKIDTDQAVIVNDSIDPGWLGIFMAVHWEESKVGVNSAATVPNWI